MNTSEHAHSLFLSCLSKVPGCEKTKHALQFIGVVAGATVFFIGLQKLQEKLQSMDEDDEPEPRRGQETFLKRQTRARQELIEPTLALRVGLTREYKELKARKDIKERRLQQWAHEQFGEHHHQETDAQDKSVYYRDHGVTIVELLPKKEDRAHT